MTEQTPLLQVGDKVRALNYRPDVSKGPVEVSGFVVLVGHSSVLVSTAKGGMGMFEFFPSDLERIEPAVTTFDVGSDQMVTVSLADLRLVVGGGSGTVEVGNARRRLQDLIQETKANG